jgi:hypothetical protein
LLERSTGRKKRGKKAKQKSLHGNGSGGGKLLKALNFPQLFFPLFILILFYFAAFYGNSQSTNSKNLINNLFGKMMRVEGRKKKGAKVGATS